MNISFFPPTFFSNSSIVLTTEIHSGILVVMANEEEKPWVGSSQQAKSGVFFLIFILFLLPFFFSPDESANYMVFCLLTKRVCTRALWALSEVRHTGSTTVEGRGGVKAVEKRVGFPFFTFFFFDRLLRGICRGLS